MQLLFCTQPEVLQDVLVAQDKSSFYGGSGAGTSTNEALKALTALVRCDYSFSDVGMGPSFHNLTLLMAPLTNEVVVSKQMLSEVAI